MASGTLKQEKVYKGSDCKTDEMSVDLPAWDSNFAFHPWSLEVSLSTKKWKSATLFPLYLKSRPRYLLGVLTRLTCKDKAREVWSSLVILGEQ